MAGLKDVSATVEDNRRLTDTLFLMTLSAEPLACAIRPGQFVHLALPTLKDHILRRPFSVYDTDVDAGTLDILYQVVGTGTAEMARWERGFVTSLIGPIGTAWEVPAGAQRALLVGGGVGAAPLFLLYRDLVSRGIATDVVLGAQTKEALVCRQRYCEVCGCEPACSTDDGTLGRKGFATVLVEEMLERASAEGKPYDYLAVCGPNPLMRAVCAQAKEAGVFAQVSLERRMACGIGACLSCVVETTSGKKRACVDGPVFDAQEVVW